MGVYLFVAFIVDSIIFGCWGNNGFSVQWDAMIIWQVWRWSVMLIYYYHERKNNSTYPKLFWIIFLGYVYIFYYWCNKHKL